MEKQDNTFLIDIKKMWKYIKKAKTSLLGYGMVSVLEAASSIIVPLITAKIILNMTSSAIKQLLLSAVSLLIVKLITSILVFFKSFFYRKIYHKTLIGLQTSLASEILNIEIEEINKNTSGLFINRLNKDTSEISGVFMQYAYYVSYFLSGIGVLISIFVQNKYLFIYSCLASLITFSIDRVKISKQAVVKKEVNIIDEKKTGLTTELVRGIKDIKVLNANEQILNEITNEMTKSSEKQMKILQISGLYAFIERNVGALLDFFFIVFGIALYKESLLTIPEFVIIYNFQNKVKYSLDGIVQLIEYNKKFVISADRIFEVIEEGKFKKETFGNKEVKRLDGNIEFKNVYFGYNKNKVIKNMSFKVKPNQTVAFIGKSGAGKTTIFSLLTKLYEVDKGEILLDGNNVNDLTRDSIRNNMSLITQEPYIFNFSIKENLLLSNDKASMKEIRDACKLACIDDYIMKLPHKYNSVIGENGVMLSGGQKQRLAIARAVLKKSEIILLDEATSALDNETQSEIQKAINNLTDSTVLIVAHRLSTVIDSDIIYVVNDGKIVEKGSHRELLKKSKYYNNMYQKELKLEQS